MPWQYKLRWSRIWNACDSLSKEETFIGSTKKSLKVGQLMNLHFDRRIKTVEV